jgi:hypothetical protein
VRKVRVSKLAQILPTGTLDYIFDDSGEKILVGPYGPVWAAENHENHQGYTTLGPYCGGLSFLFVGLRTIKLENLSVLEQLE